MKRFVAAGNWKPLLERLATAVRKASWADRRSRSVAHPSKDPWYLHRRRSRPAVEANRNRRTSPTRRALWLSSSGQLRLRHPTIHLRPCLTFTKPLPIWVWKRFISTFSLSLQIFFSFLYYGVLTNVACHNSTSWPLFVALAPYNFFFRKCPSLRGYYWYIFYITGCKRVFCLAKRRTRVGTFSVTWWKSLRWLFLEMVFEWIFNEPRLKVFPLSLFFSTLNGNVRNGPTHIKDVVHQLGKRKKKLADTSDPKKKKRTVSCVQLKES